MLNMIPKSLRVLLKLCSVAAILIACAGCMPIANGLMIIGTHDGLNRMNPNQNSGEIIYTQTPYVEPDATQTNPDAAKFTYPRTTEAASTKADEEVGP